VVCGVGASAVDVDQSDTTVTQKRLRLYGPDLTADLTPSHDVRQFPAPHSAETRQTEAGAEEG